MTGTPFTLQYWSERTPGFGANRTVRVTLARDIPPETLAVLKRIELEVLIAGQLHRLGPFAPPAGDPGQLLTSDFTWDGKDVYGRQLQGEQPATIRIGYVYDAEYMQPAQFENSFGRFSGVSFEVPIGARSEVVLWAEHQRLLGSWDARGMGLGGWTLDVHHAYDPIGKVLHLGDGRRLSISDKEPIIKTVVGNGQPALLNGPSGVAIGPDGSLYITDTANRQVKRLSPGGQLVVVAGNGSSCGGYTASCGQGGPATAASLNAPAGIALGRDGSLFIADPAINWVWKVSASGIITRYAGSTHPRPLGDGGPAYLATLSNPQDVAVDPEGNVYIADTNQHRIRRVARDGDTITTIAGNGTACSNPTAAPGSCGDSYRGTDGVFHPGPARTAQLNTPSSVAIGPEGAIYIADTGTHRIRTVTNSGLIQRVAGTGYNGYYPGDGGRALSTHLSYPQDLEIGPDGRLYITRQTKHCVHLVDASGFISTIAGSSCDTAGFAGDGAVASSSVLNRNRAMALGPDGRLYLVDKGNNRVRAIGSALPAFSSHAITVPAPDGTLVFTFDPYGRQLSTTDLFTGQVRYRFEYAAGLLDRVIDAHGRSTRVRRNAWGTPEAIIAPDGHETRLALDSSGYLTVVSNPQGERYRFSYGPGGLLQRMTTPRGGMDLSVGSTTYTYDALGRLTRAVDPAGGFQALTRSAADDWRSYSVDRQTASGTGTNYQVVREPHGDISWINTFASGLLARVDLHPDGAWESVVPDGTRTAHLAAADPIFGMAAPYLAEVLTSTPGGRSQRIQTARTTQPAALLDLADLVSWEQVECHNGSGATASTCLSGRRSHRHYDAAVDTWTFTSPEDRIETMALYPTGQVRSRQVNGLAAVHYEYDSAGRVIRVTRGSGAEAREWAARYNTAGWPEAVQDPLGRETLVGYDGVGRVTSVTRPDGMVTALGYDANGNITSITPPEKPRHAFGYTPVDLEQWYGPPAIGLPEERTEYRYTKDRQLDLVIRPDGLTIEYRYDTAGRLWRITSPSGISEYTYYPAGDPQQGNVHTVGEPGGTILIHGWDGFLLTSVDWAGAVNGRVGLGYDNNFWLSTVSVQGTEVTPFTTAYGYDDDGLLVSAGVMTLQRDAQRGGLVNIIEVVAGAKAVREQLGYNSFGELTSCTVTSMVSGASANLLNVDYGERDKLGRIVSRSETVLGEPSEHRAYEYDPANRLWKVHENGVLVREYEYDGNGNRRYIRDGSGTVIAGGLYDDQDRLMVYADLWAGRHYEYQYTANGELWRKSETNELETTLYDYDVFGNLRAVSLPDGRQIEYLIDGQHRRIGKKTRAAGSASWTLHAGYLYQDQLRVAAELDGAGAVVSRFVYGTKINVPEYMESKKEDGSWHTYRIVTDHLGSVRMVVRVDNGAVLQRMDYNEFGVVQPASTGIGFVPFGFAGGLYDPDTGLVRFGARDYDPQTGRWTNKDPILFEGGSPDLYVYTHNDPVNVIDSDGKGPGAIAVVVAGGAAVIVLYIAIDCMQKCMDYQKASGNSADQCISEGVPPTRPWGQCISVCGTGSGIVAHALEVVLSGASLAGEGAGTVIGDN